MLDILLSITLSLMAIMLLIAIIDVIYTIITKITGDIQLRKYKKKQIEALDLYIKKMEKREEN